MRCSNCGKDAKEGGFVLCEMAKERKNHLLCCINCTIDYLRGMKAGKHKKQKG